MDKPRRGVALKIWGDFACFSRPEFKVERVSYPIITPSAARGVLEAIFWKPEIRYEIREIHVLKLGSQISVLRNEIEETQSRHPIVVEGKRAQRTALILKNVCYVIRAEIALRVSGADPGGYLDQFNRRAERGQCHHMPCLGTREFAASFEPPGDDDSGEKRNPELNLHTGNMLFEIAYVEGNRQNTNGLTFWKRTGDSRREVKGRAVPLFFNAVIERGVVSVPRQKYDELYAIEGGNA